MNLDSNFGGCDSAYMSLIDPQVIVPVKLEVPNMTLQKTSDMISQEPASCRDVYQPGICCVQFMQRLALAQCCTSQYTCITHVKRSVSHAGASGCTWL